MYNFLYKKLYRYRYHTEVKFLTRLYRSGITFLNPSILKDFFLFKKLSKESNLQEPSFADYYPCAHDRTGATIFDRHYVYHLAWAARKLKEINPLKHIDVSSSVHFSTIVSAFIPVTFYDYRPLDVRLSQFDSLRADLNKLPFETSSLSSVSCMHVIEHIGLGRYGDTLDAVGDRKAISELQRVTMQGGGILFVVPVGKPKVEFNAHRIYSYEQIIDLFTECTLKEFSLIPDNGYMEMNADPALAKEQSFGCGCFWFVKK